jgi:O-antigen/teichoic acid export membrane protein
LFSGLELTATWFWKVPAAILDQGLYAGTNLLVTVLLARWMSSTEYGAFSVAYSLFLLLAAFHGASITEPMLVFSGGRHADHLSRYLALLLKGQWRVGAAVAAVLGAAGAALWAVGQKSLATAVGGLAAASPFTLFMWTARRALYARSQPSLAAAAGMVYLVLYVVGLWSLAYTGTLSSASAFGVMGATSGVVGAALSLSLNLARHSKDESLTLRVVTSDHWRYARWSAPAVAVMWIAHSLYYAVIPAFAGLEGAAALRALTNLIMPVLNGMVAIVGLLSPLLARSARQGQLERVRSLVGLSVALFVTASAVNLALLLAAGSPIVRWLYGERYSGHIELLVPLALLPVCYSLWLGPASALRAMERVSDVFWAHVGSGALTITLGIALMASFGVAGAAVGLLVSTGGTALFVGIAYVRALRRAATP